MRPKLILALLLLGAGTVIGLLLISPRATQRMGQPPPPGSAAPAQDAPVVRTGPASAPELAEPNQGRAAAPGEPPGMEASTPETYTERLIDQLGQLGMTGDTNSLTIILSELTNRDPRVRRAALDASVQFGSRAAVPALSDAWSQTDNPEEKVALQKAIDFLKLPGVSELHAAAGPQP